MSTPRVLELFAGCGGAALGLSRAGWKHVACVERDEAAAATLAAAGFPVLRADVRDVDWAPFAGVDLVWASPPCQPGSTAGKRRGTADERDGWPWTIAALDAIRPTWFLAENVLGWTLHGDRCALGVGCVGCMWETEILPEIARLFPFTGVWKLDAADFGVPQHRRRLLLWGGPVPIPPPAPTHANPAGRRGLAAWRTLGEAVGDTLFADDVCDHRACYPCDGSHGRACTEPWRRDRPAPTVTTTEVKGTRAHAPDWSMNGGPDRVSDAAFLVAGVRRIEVAEGLVLQGLPADWPLQGTREDQYRQVGNAVPPTLASVSGTVVAACRRAVADLGRRGFDLDAVAAAIRRAPRDRRRSRENLLRLEPAEGGHKGWSLPTIIPLTVSAGSGITLDMGVAERTVAGILVKPPSQPLVEQVIAWLDARPEAEPVEPDSPRAAIATVLVCIRWGTWLARLADPALPVWSHAKEPRTSCVTDEEMARLNIEASYALGVWIELLRTDSERWSKLAGRAVRNLPWPGGTVKPSRTSPFWMLADPRLHAAVEGLPADVRLQARASLRSNPTRVLANAAAQNAWRNGPIEDVHAGRYIGVPLTHRRVPQDAEKRVVNHAAGELAVAIAQIAKTRTQTATEWMDTVLPFALPIGIWSAPRDWSTTEASRAVALVQP